MLGQVLEAFRVARANRPVLIHRGVLRLVGPEPATAGVALALATRGARVTAVRRSAPHTDEDPGHLTGVLARSTSLEGPDQPIVSTEVWTTASIASASTGWLKWRIRTRSSAIASPSHGGDRSVMRVRPGSR